MPVAALEIDGVSTRCGELAAGEVRRAGGAGPVREFSRRPAPLAELFGNVMMEPIR